jgi:hypothetical protein
MESPRTPHISTRIRRLRMGFQSMLIALTTALLALRNALRPRPSVNVTRNSEPHGPKGSRVENGDVGGPTALSAPCR